MVTGVTITMEIGMETIMILMNLLTFKSFETDGGTIDMAIMDTDMATMDILTRTSITEVVSDTRTLTIQMDMA